MIRSINLKMLKTSTYQKFLSTRDELIYISRSVIRDQKTKNRKIKYFKQVCIYAFDKDQLKNFFK